MRELNPLRLALVFAGCFLGAGYVSGQELWQFFGAYGLGGYFGIVIAVALLVLFGILVLRLTQITGETEMDRVILPGESRVLRLAVGALEVLFLFGVVAVMSAGIGALGEQLFGLPIWVGCLLLSALVLLTALAGLRGIVAAFSVSVPILVAATVIFGIIAVKHYDLSAVQWRVTAGENPLLGNWLSGAVNFACYNITGAIGILIPFGEFVPKKRTIYAGLSLGAAALLLIALSVLTALTLSPAAAEAELPMLALVAGISPGFAYAYGALLAFSMFGTSLSCFVAMMNYLQQKFAWLAHRPRLSPAALMALCFAASLFGFGDLIGVIYPLFGYASAVFLLLMLLHYFKVRRRPAVPVSTPEAGDEPRSAN